MNKPTTSCPLTQSSQYPISHVFGVSNDCFPSAWVLNSGVIDHMTYSSQCFFSYNPCSKDKKIKIVDGTLAIVASQGKFSLTSTLTLKFVLYVPKLSAILLVIHQITKYLNCTITFFHLIVLSRTKH